MGAEMFAARGLEFQANNKLAGIVTTLHILHVTDRLPQLQGRMHCAGRG